MELIGPYLIGCVLLVGAGAIKVARPDDTARAVLPMVPRRLRPVVPFRVLRTLIRSSPRSRWLWSGWACSCRDR